MLHTDIQERWSTVGGVRIHILVAGESGPPVILLHGGGLDSASISWGGVIGPLSERHRVFAPDLPGYGKSDRPRRTYTITYYAEVLEALMEQWGVDRASLVGISMGGAIALTFALQHPARMEKLVLVDTYGIQRTVSLQALSYLFVHLPGVTALTYALLRRSKWLLRQTLLASIVYSPRRLSPELVEQVYQAVHDPDVGEAFLSLQKSEMQWNGLRTDLTALLQALAVPTLFIHGEQDQAVPVHWAREAHERVANSRLYIIPETRHAPQLEKPEEFNRVLLGFLTGESSDPGFTSV